MEEGGVVGQDVIGRSFPSPSFPSTSQAEVVGAVPQPIMGKSTRRENSHVPCGTPERRHAPERGAALRVLQLLSRAFQPTRHACDGKQGSRDRVWELRNLLIWA